MNRWTKLGVVLSGYVLAAVASGVAVWVYDRQFSPADDQAMGGMIAGGEMLLGGGVFLCISLAPTALALWFLRRHRPTWSALSVAVLAFALLGLASVVSLVAERGATAHEPLVMLLGFFSVIQMLGSPLWIAAFALFAWLAPERDLKRRMILASAIEALIGAFGLVHFLSPAIPL
jgi:hypothetical protein